MRSIPLCCKLASARRRALLCDPAALAGLFSPFLDPAVPVGSGERRRLVPALTTLWRFLYQCLSGFLGCREVVLRLSMQFAAAMLPMEGSFVDKGDELDELCRASRTRFAAQPGGDRQPSGFGSDPWLPRGSS